MSDFQFRDLDTERELELTNWVRENSINMWLGVKVLDTGQVLISHIDERLAVKLGYYTPHTSLLSQPLSIIMSDSVDAKKHDKLCGDHINQGRGPLPLTRTNPDKFRLKHRDGTEFHVIVNARVLEAKFCKGFCTAVEGETVLKYGMSEITFVDDLPQHVKTAMQEYQARQDG